MEIETYVKSCHGCTMVTAPPPPEPLKRKELPNHPWQNIAMDFLGPLPSGDYTLSVQSTNIRSKLSAPWLILRIF